MHSFRLQSTQFDKKSFLAYLKGYMKEVKTKLQEKSPDRVTTFEQGAQGFAKKIVANFKDYEFVRVPLDYIQILRLMPVWSLVHWRVDEPRRHDCAAQLPGGRCYP